MRYEEEVNTNEIDDDISERSLGHRMDDIETILAKHGKPIFEEIDDDDDIRDKRISSVVLTIAEYMEKSDDYDVEELKNTPAKNYKNKTQYDVKFDGLKDRFKRYSDESDIREEEWNTLIKHKGKLSTKYHQENFLQKVNNEYKEYLKSKKSDDDDENNDDDE